VIHPMQYELEQAYHLQRQQECIERRRVAMQVCTAAQTSCASLLRQAVHAVVIETLRAGCQKSQPLPRVVE
jgi:hypothetical protein